MKPSEPRIEERDERPRASPGPLDWARLALGAVRRRKLVTAAVVLAGVAGATAYYVLTPPTYRVEAKILAQRQQALPSVVRSVYEEQPTRSAWEMIHRRENLVALVRQASLLPEPASGVRSAERTETPPHRSIRDRLRSIMRGTSANVQDDPVDVMVSILDRKLIVGVVDGTITIQVDWRDPRQAYEIVQAALQNFLEMRHVQEVKAIDEVISVLQSRAAALHEELEVASEDAHRRASQPARLATTRLRQASPDLVRLQSLVESKQRAIQDVEEFRRRRLADLQAQLDQARSTLSDAHPTVINLRKDIEALSRESPQIEALRDEERKLRKDFQDRLAREGFPAPTSPATVFETGTRSEEDPRVREARARYDDMMTRVSTAQVELEAARAAFKYRYNVIWPPEVPSDPVSPDPRRIFGFGALVSLLLGIAAALAPDVLRGRIVERWQVEHELDLPVLGEMRRR
jgi:uncharacterized protein involved in exopolysaccharide biosynthesis